MTDQFIRILTSTTSGVKRIHQTSLASDAIRSRQHAFLSRVKFFGVPIIVIVNDGITLSRFRSGAKHRFHEKKGGAISGWSNRYSPVVVFPVGSSSDADCSGNERKRNPFQVMITVHSTQAYASSRDYSQHVICGFVMVGWLADSDMLQAGVNPHEVRAQKTGLEIIKYHPRHLRKKSGSVVSTQGYQLWLISD